jgi:hypothetical protein
MLPGGIAHRGTLTLHGIGNFIHRRHARAHNALVAQYPLTAGEGFEILVVIEV